MGTLAVRVSLNANGISAVSPDPAAVPSGRGQGNGPTTIIWTLTGPNANNFDWSATPITFSSSNPSSTQFGAPSVNGKAMSVTDSGLTSGSYSYDLWVQADAGPAKPHEFDPIIQNQ